MKLNITSKCYRYDSTTGTFTVPLGGDGSYYCSVYCLQIRQHNWDIHSALWWRWILLLLCLLFTDTTTQLGHLQCPLVEMYTITSLFIVYRYDRTTGTFTVPSGGDGFYYFSVYFVVIFFKSAAFDIQINGEVLCTAFTEEHQQAQPDYGQAACSAASSVTEGLVIKTHLNTMLVLLFINTVQRKDTCPLIPPISF